MVPIFFFAVLSLVYLLEIMNVQTVMRSALHCAAKEIAEEAYVNPLVIRGKLEKHIVEHVGETWLDHSVISGGSDGIDCRKSMAWGSTGIMDLSLIYKVEVPILMFRIPAIVQEESMRVKGWNAMPEMDLEIKVMRLSILQIPELYIIKMQIARIWNCL